MEKNLLLKKKRLLVEDFFRKAILSTGVNITKGYFKD